jgi:hypothetical protein
MPRVVNDFRSKKDEVVRECGDQRGAIRIWSHHKSEKQKRRKNPRKPLDLNWQNKKDVDDLVWIKSRKCKKQRRDEHAVGKIPAEKECGDGGADHPYEEIECESERPPGAFKTFADKPQKPERQHHPKA